MINFYSIYNNGSILNKYLDYNGFFEIRYWSRNQEDQLAPYLSLIKKEPRMVYNYARTVIEGRWLDGESIIKKDPIYLFWYIIDIIGGRWVEMEPMIAQDQSLASWYNYKFGTDI